jgi:hypothetical protein
MRPGQKRNEPAGVVEESAVAVAVVAAGIVGRLDPMSGVIDRAKLCMYT